MAEVAKCTKCATSISESHTQPWCTKCGEAFSKDFQEGLPALVALRARAKSVSELNAGPVESQPPAIGGILGAAGAALVIWGMFRWNSAESQLIRLLGQPDSMLLTLFIVGGCAVVAAIALGMSPKATPTSSPVAAIESVEDRLRRLQDLKEKQLISDSEFEERKRQIIGSL
jgi:hypothetical protein